MKPALTAEEWAKESGLLDPNDHHHKIAAIHLRGQPFGFTWGDVEMLLEPTLSPEGQMDEREDLARRIEALLPPRTCAHE